MIMDNTLVFSDGQSITGDAGSTNNVDILLTGVPYGSSARLSRDIGKSSHRIPLNVVVTETFNNLTSLTVSLQVDDSAAFSSPKTVAVSDAILAAKLVAGYRLPFPDYIPEGSDEQFMRLYYDVTGTAPSTGKITASVVAARQTN